MANSKIFLVALLGALVCSATARTLSTSEEKVHVGGASTDAATDDSKIDIGIGLAPPPGTLAVSANDTVNLGTPGLAPPPGNLVSIGTNNTAIVDLPHVRPPPVGV